MGVKHPPDEEALLWKRLQVGKVHRHLMKV